MNKSPNVAVLIFACDRYELLFKGFDYFFNENWDHTILLKKYFTTEHKELKIKGYTNLKSGDGAWSDRLKIVLNQIDEDYIIFMQEDMWLNKKIPEGVLHQILSYVTENELKLVKLHSSDVYRTNELNTNFSGFKLSEVIKKDSNFLMSHQVSIWSKDFLKKQLKKNEHPWRNERLGSKRLKKSTDSIFQIDLLSENENKPINQNDKKVTPGGYSTISLNACIHPKAEFFISKLKDVLPEYAQRLDYNMQNKITHDGKEGLRKDDFIKKIKNKIRSLTTTKKS